jgi:hypothetical protein
MTPSPAWPSRSRRTRRTGQDVFNNSIEIVWIDSTATDWEVISFGATVPAGARRCCLMLEAASNPSTSAAVCVVDFDKVEVLRSRFGETITNWVDVRGAEDVTPGADQVTFFDYEAPPGVTNDYRARAVKSDGSIGEWVLLTDSLSWDATAVHFISLEDPTENRTFDLAEPPEPVEEQRRVVMPIDGARFPVVVSDGARSARQFKLVVKTGSAADVAALKALCARDVIVIHAPSSYDFDSGYWALGNLREKRLAREGAFRHKHWEIDAIEVDVP